MEAISKEQEQWLKENTFECPALKARISLAQCEEIRQRPTIKEFANGKQVHPLKNCRPEECDSCNVWKEFQQGKEKKAQKKGMAVCQECGKLFKPYKNGAFMVTSICKDCLIAKRCMRIKMSKQNQNGDKEKKEKPKFHHHVLWNLLKAEEELLLTLQERAKEEVRTLEQQIVYELKKGVLSSNEL